MEKHNLVTKKYASITTLHESTGYSYARHSESYLFLLKVSDSLKPSNIYLELKNETAAIV